MTDSQTAIARRKELAKDPANREIIFEELLEKYNRPTAHKITNMLIKMMS